MALRGDYDESFRQARNILMQWSQDAARRAKELWLEKKYANALFWVGYYGWMRDAYASLSSLQDAYNREPGIVPYTDLKDYRTRRNEMKDVAQSIARALYRDAFCPMTSTEASPVFMYWNRGDLTPAILMAGRWKACQRFWSEILIPWFGWCDDARRNCPIPDADRIVPFPGNVAGGTYPV